MDKKTIGIITVLITTILCGLPSLAGLCFGSLAILGSFLPDAGTPTQDAALVVGISVMVLGVSLIGIAIPVGIGTWTWWSQKAKTTVSLEEILIPEDDF